MKTAKLLFSLLLISSIACNSQTNETKSLDNHIKEKAVKMNSSSDLDQLITSAGDKKLVLLGEASHGTHEYYTWRDSISRRLISEHDFSFIVVEGDYASLYNLNKYVKDMPGAANSATEALISLERWPTWMWANEEVVNLAEWLREFNSTLPENEKVGFYGMDVYNEWESKEVLLDLFEEKSSDKYKKIKNHYDCFAPYKGDSWAYARNVQAGIVNCYQNALDVVNLIKNLEYEHYDFTKYEYLYALQNAFVFKNAERFYRKSALGQRDQSWNARATHMFETAERKLDFYGDDSKGIVWAHNTHIGDASYTDMARAGQTNIGELSRKQLGDDNVFLIGFTTYKGRVQAGSQWGSRRIEMNVIPAQRNSIEEIMNRTGLSSFYLIFDESDRNHEEFMQRMGNRAIGVVYNPEADFRQFVPTVVPMRYDALIFFNTTHALNPLKEE